MKSGLLLFLLAIVLCLAGCKKDTVSWAPLGDSAPEFGKTTELGTLPGFLTGRWCVDGMNGPEKSRYYEFKADGTFETGHTGIEWKSTGKWTEANGTVNLTYETMNGKALQAFQAEYKKDEEGGGQVSVQRALTYDGIYSEIEKMTSLVIDEDKKTLSFGGRPVVNLPEGGGEGGEALGELMRAASVSLVRMGPKKD